MRYLTIAPNYTGSCIRDDFNGPIDLIDLNLPQEFVDEVNAWHSSYRKIIPLSESQRKAQTKMIDSLDTQGLKIAEKLKSLISGGAKVRYFSEGKLQYLSI